MPPFLPLRCDGESQVQNASTLPLGAVPIEVHSAAVSSHPGNALALERNHIQQKRRTLSIREFGVSSLNCDLSLCTVVYFALGSSSAFFSRNLSMKLVSNSPARKPGSAKIRWCSGIEV